jgi:hypothetical protein
VKGSCREYGLVGCTCLGVLVPANVKSTPETTGGTFYVVAALASELSQIG